VYVEQFDDDDASRLILKGVDESLDQVMRGTHVEMGAGVKVAVMVIFAVILLMVYDVTAPIEVAGPPNGPTVTSSTRYPALGVIKHSELEPLGTLVGLQDMLPFGPALIVTMKRSGLGAALAIAPVEMFPARSIAQTR
jgi:hypothetical protein